MELVEKITCSERFSINENRPWVEACNSKATSCTHGHHHIGISQTERPKLGDFARATIALQGTSEANVERYMQVRNNRTRRNIAFASPMASNECSCTRKHGSGNGDG